MNSLIDRFKNQLDSDEIEQFLDELEKTEEGKTFIEQLEDFDLETLKGLHAGVFITNAYLLAKMSEMNDKLTELEELTVSLSEE